MNAGAGVLYRRRILIGVTTHSTMLADERLKHDQERPDATVPTMMMPALLQEESVVAFEQGHALLAILLFPDNNLNVDSKFHGYRL